MPGIGRKCLHTSQVANQTRAYPSFCSMKQLGVFYTPLDGMLVDRRASPVLNLQVPICTPEW